MDAHSNNNSNTNDSSSNNNNAPTAPSTHQFIHVPYDIPMGSFNPLHTMHTASLDIAKMFMEQNNTFLKDVNTNTNNNDNNNDNNNSSNANSRNSSNTNTNNNNKGSYNNANNSNTNTSYNNNTNTNNKVSYNNTVSNSNSKYTYKKSEKRAFKKKKWDRSATQYAAVGGFVAPSSDRYVTGKLGKFAMSLDHRNAMTKIATADSDWIDVCEWGVASGATTTSSIEKTVQQYIAKIQVFQRQQNLAGTFDATLFPDLTDLDIAQIRGIEVCGADHALNYKLWRRKAMICIGRSCSTEAMKKEMTIDARTTGMFREDFFFVECTGEMEHLIRPISSTEIRAKFQQKQEQDLANNGWIHQGVLDYLKLHSLL